MIFRGKGGRLMHKAGTFITLTGGTGVDVSACVLLPGRSLTRDADQWLEAMEHAISLLSRTAQDENESMATNGLKSQIQDSNETLARCRDEAECGHISRCNRFLGRHARIFTPAGVSQMFMLD